MHTSTAPWCLVTLSIRTCMRHERGNKAHNNGNRLFYNILLMMAKLFQLKEIFPSDATSVMDEFRNKLHFLPRSLAHVLGRRTNETALR